METTMTLKEEILSWDRDELQNIIKSGCVSGACLSYIYYHETTDAYDKHKDEIWDALGDVSQQLDQEPLELIASFNGIKNVAYDYQFKNLLVWWYIEYIAFDEVESNPHIDAESN